MSNEIFAVLKAIAQCIQYDINQDWKIPKSRLTPYDVYRNLIEHGDGCTFYVEYNHHYKSWSVL